MTATAPASQAEIERTEHPHVIKGGALGGQPRIDDQRISVLQLFDMHAGGWSVEDIHRDLPTLTLAEIYDAISYGHDHPEEMAYWRERRKLRNVLRRGDMVYVEGRLIPRRALKESDIPPGVTSYTWETLPEELNS